MYEKYQGLTVDEFLKKKILDDFGSVSAFAREAGLAYSTVNSALTRGIAGASYKTSKKILDTLGVSSAVIDFWDPLEPLPEEIQRKEEKIELNEKDKREITKILDSTREQLMSADGLLYDGEPASEESVDALLDLIEAGMEIAKKRNKEKYTPKKYRK
ncbi:helix-turn-helix domain-containing protein [Eubacterium limosum]|uniref:helix-turn-helix domain-containing protein n=1 Tax=Eubacterium limosum TaxID=1736 RepID=UPI001D061697|nr:helix-turn-helix domain-containing protein [Eubacterium limosum]MCB6569526.1 helix-turn-helix domain-containing protein [Eubacterium limosum]